MVGQDLERAHYIQKMFAKCMDKVDRKLDHDGRMQAAAKLMDEKLGKAWRNEANPDDIEFIELDVVGTGKPQLDKAPAKAFYEKLGMAGDDEGLGTRGTEAPDDREAGGDKKAFVAAVLAAVEKFL